jgi:hypothetical protein
MVTLGKLTRGKNRSDKTEGFRKASQYHHAASFGGEKTSNHFLSGRLPSISSLVGLREHKLYVHLIPISTLPITTKTSQFTAHIPYEESS